MYTIEIKFKNLMKRWKNWCLTIFFPHKICDICNIITWVAIMHFRKWQLIWTEILIKLLYKLFNELIFFSEENIFLFEKFHVLCVTYGVLQKYLRIACITMIQNKLMNSISVYWKKLTGMSYIIKSWSDGPYKYNNCEIEVLFWDSKLSSWNYEQNVGQ
jgi:hypothetical protein